MQTEMNASAVTDTTTREGLLALFRETATEVVERDFHHVVEATVITELTIDSLGMLEIIGSMERQLKIQIPDEMLSGITTIHDLLDVVEKRQAIS
jgi:acyl carrier protein